VRLSFDDNIPALSDALASFIKYERVTIPQGLRYQGRLLGQRLIDFTPPKNRSQGRAAVLRDTVRATHPLKPSFFTSAKIRNLVRKRDYAALEAVFSKFHSGILAGALVFPFAPDLHQKQRDQRGRVRRDARQATPDASEVREYVARIRENVGEGKGGWAASVIALGGHPAQWIAEHKSAGAIEDHAASLNSYIRMVNHSRWASGGDEDRIVPNAIRSRTRDIQTYLAKAQSEAKQKAKLK
jgi:hypothetical protein